MLKREGGGGRSDRGAANPPQRFWDRLASPSGVVNMDEDCQPAYTKTFRSRMSREDRKIKQWGKKKVRREAEQRWSECCTAPCQMGKVTETASVSLCRPHWLGFTVETKEKELCITSGQQKCKLNLIGLNIYSRMNNLRFCSATSAY